MKLMWRACVISATEMHFTCPLVCTWVWVAYVLPVENDTGVQCVTTYFKQLNFKQLVPFRIKAQK